MLVNIYLLVSLVFLSGDNICVYIYLIVYVSVRIVILLTKLFQG